MTMGIEFETYLRKDIFPNDQSAVDMIMDLYERSDEERHYIYYVLESYRQGQYSRHSVWKWLMGNVILKYKRQYECNAKYLDDEYQAKMKGGK